jgi:hypothetical protein
MSSFLRLRPTPFVWAVFICLHWAKFLDLSDTVVYSTSQRWLPGGVTDSPYTPAGRQAVTRLMRVDGLAGGTDEGNNAIP